MDLRNGEYFYELGKQAFQVQKYDDSLRFYKKAIIQDNTNALYYIDRSLCNLKLECYNDALEDAHSAIQIDSKSPRAHYQLGQCYVASGSYVMARHTLRKLEKINPNFASLTELLSKIATLEKHEMELLGYIKTNSFELALNEIKSILELSPANSRVRSLQIECLLKQKQLDKAEEYYYEYLCNEEHLPEIKYLRALLNYYRNELDTAMQLCKVVINADPDCVKAVKLIKLIKSYKDVLAQGSKAFASGDFKKADEIYSCGINIDPSNDKANLKLYVNKTITSIKIKSYKDAISYGSKAISLDSNNLKAFVNRAEGYLNVGDKDSATKDFMTAYTLHKDENILKKLEELKLKNAEKNEEYVNKFFEQFKKEDESKFEKNESHEEPKKEDNTKSRLEELKSILNKMKTMKPNEILGVGEDANENQIRKGYSSCVKKYHPDHVAQYPQLKEVCEEIFKLIQTAKRNFEDKRKSK